jgi:glyoxylase-like metal-dependent hydrolase (beta-lactamase superfamily II)
MTSAMATEQVADGVHRSSDGIVNWYLLEEDGELTIVDTGWPRSWPDVGRAVQSIGRRLEDVRAVALTHGHGDHMGSAEEARSNLSVPVRAHHLEIPRLKGQRRGGSSWALVPRLLPQMWRPSAFAFVLHAARHGFLTPKWLTDVVAFEPDGVLDVPGKPRAIFTPGHTEGHTSYHVPAAGVLLAGDELVTLDPVTRATGPRLIHPAVNDDHDQARASLDQFAGVDAGILLPGHGEPWRGALSQAVALAREADTG